MASQSELSKLQAVKELIFGQEIEGYEAEFKKLHEEIQSNKTDSAQELAAHQTEFANFEKLIISRLDKLENTLLKKISLLEEKKVDKAKLGKMLIQIGEKLQDN